MDIQIKGLPPFLNDYDVTKLIAQVLHSEAFVPTADESDDEELPSHSPIDKRINFKVKLNRSLAGSVRNDGTGILTVPSDKIGKRFLSYVKGQPIKVEKRKINFWKRAPAPPHIASLLGRTPFVDPEIEETHERIVESLNVGLRVDRVQFGVLFRTRYDKPVSREFSAEWSKEFTTRGVAWLRFEYDHKLIRITLGDSTTEMLGSSIALNFINIQRMALGYQGKPHVVFELLTPPVLERIQFHRHPDDDRKSKLRIGYLDEAHQLVSPYAWQLRIELTDKDFMDLGNVFCDLCKKAGIDNLLLRMVSRGPGNRPVWHKIEASGHKFFERRRIERLCREFAKFPWPVAFQLEALLRNGLITTGEIESSLPGISELCDTYPEHECSRVGDILRKFNIELGKRPATESPASCFSRVMRDFQFPELRITPGHFLCCHIIFTPTRTVLEGPYPVQSNRIIRRYPGYEHHFIRVEFRDEDRLSYRWDRTVDGSHFVRDRVGGILANGFELGGRSFQFLAYSTSALREHSVWFLNEFYHYEAEYPGWVTAQDIRDSIGHFPASSKLLKQPSKYAARLAQAFTATEPSVKIMQHEWEEMPDIGKDPYLFTDGYQIRFLGYKGMVAVDEEMDKDASGIHMRLRPSMRKFDSREEDMREADIEIARHFAYPNNVHQQNLGVGSEEFEKLQQRAVASVERIHDGVDEWKEVLRSNSLGRQFRLPYVLDNLKEMGLSMQSRPGRRPRPGFDSPFFQKIREVARMAILRDIKHNARFEIPDSFKLVGIADEGPAYRAAVKRTSCVQRNEGESPIWLEGNCVITRSPVTHPGDVQRVHAIGKPPEGMLCSFRNLKNLVVLPSVGERSLCSKLSGGDLDGDLYDIIMCEELLYSQQETRTLGRATTVDDICNFIVEYINSDVVGLLSDRLLVIADQSKQGIFDVGCAVDYPKQGIPVDLENGNLPRPLMRQSHITARNDYYRSDKALGRLYRNIQIRDVAPLSNEEATSTPSGVNAITSAIERRGAEYIDETLGFDNDLVQLFKRYAEELRYICTTHTVSNTPGVELIEEEVIVGTILANCSQSRWRRDRIGRMNLHMSQLIHTLLTFNRAVQAWKLSVAQYKDWGAKSFGLITLAYVFECFSILETARDGAAMIST
ncbi:RNA dependent RNA polymerase-domain-containing protein [Schizophyllum amplum]|uniref:RNA-dependent RNA polymerase n=1 Tax=Schizophyllum amplum TaxID=97359 RepID=A0A550BS28_9AGAR|nr:RNA dependent RNA polymerase-domain-containing protein [Auriculariopsis ampla]